MPLSELDGTTIPTPADFHVHLRQDAMMELVTPTITPSGIDTVFVMPNLIPPITTVQRALEYKSQLQILSPSTTFLMSLYLHPSITRETVKEAKKAGIVGIKSYPAGVTTNSSSGVVSYEQFHDVFDEMQNQDLVLNLHGEVPSSSSPNNNDKQRPISVLNAEESFLPTLFLLHSTFPKLRIVLEHCTSQVAIEAVKQCGNNVVATITAHHLSLTVDDWAGDPHCFCKPVAKTHGDRMALLKTVVGEDNRGKFFFGSDSAPHPVGSKRADKVAAGVFTQMNAVGIVLDAIDNAVEKGWLEDKDVDSQEVVRFLSIYGREFYGGEAAQKGTMVRLVKNGATIADMLESKDGNIQVLPFRRGQSTWSVTHL